MRLDRAIFIQINQSYRKFCLLDRALINFAKNESIEAGISEIMKTVEHKIHVLGIHKDLQSCDPNEVVHHLSSAVLPERVKILLAFGLDFDLLVRKLNFDKFYAALKQKRSYALSKEQCSANIQEFYPGPKV